MKFTGQFRKLIRNSTKSLFVKVFIVCTAISLFTVAIMGIYTYKYILKNLDSEIEKYEKKKLNETLNISKMQLGEMQKLILNYALTNKYTQFAYIPRGIVNMNYRDIQNIQEFISNSINSSNYIENIFFYFDNDNYVLDYSGLTSLSSYYDNGWYKYYSSMSDTRAVLDTRKVVSRGSSTDLYNNIITFITKIPYSNTSKDGAVVLNVDIKIISDLLKNITEGENHALALLVGKDGTILSANKDVYIYQNITDVINIPHSYLDLSAGNFKFNLNGIKMVSYFETSSINDWKLFYIESENVIFKKSVYIKFITLITSVILLLLTAGISLILSFKLYRPIRKIISNIKAMSYTSDENTSDISMIHGSLNLLFENNKNLEIQLKQNELLMRQIFLSQLITGRLFNKAEIMNKAEYFSIDLSFDFFKVAVIQASSMFSVQADVEQYEHYKIAVINMVTKVFESLGIDVVCSQDSNENIIVLIKLLEVKVINEIEAIIEQTFEDIKENLAEYKDHPVSIGIGSIYSDLSEIGVSYTEAVKALHFKFLKGDHSVISYREIARDKEKLHYPVESEQKLISVIKLCDYEKTASLLNEMLNSIMDNNYNIQHLEICLSNMIGLIQRCIYELNLDSKVVFGEDSIDSVSIEEFKNQHQFFEWISTKFRIIIEYLIDQQKDNMKSFVTETSDYLKNVYMQDISLDSVANYFNYSSSYFCKIFKEKMKISFWEYVAKLRIENSKILLLETENTVEQIAEMVGYNNRFSYIRTFKKYTSITPSEYRLTRNN